MYKPKEGEFFYRPAYERVGYVIKEGYFINILGRGGSSIDFEETVPLILTWGKPYVELTLKNLLGATKEFNNLPLHINKKRVNQLLKELLC